MSKCREWLLLRELTESFLSNDLQFDFIENRNATAASMPVTEKRNVTEKGRGSSVVASHLIARKCLLLIWHGSLFSSLWNFLNARSCGIQQN